MRVSLNIAESTLAQLVDAALAGEEVVISKDGYAVVQIVPVKKPNGFKFGLLEGQLGDGPDFFEPMGEEDLALWEGRT